MRRFGFEDKTKWALYEYAPLTASGFNEILAMGQTKRQMLELAGSEGIHIRTNGTGRWRIDSLEELTKPVPPGPGEIGYKLNRDEIAEFAHRWDARVGRIPG